MSNINDRTKSTESKEFNPINYIKVTDTFTLVNSDDLYGNSLVWKENYISTAEAVQISMLVRQSKQSAVIRALVKRNNNDMNVISAYRRMAEFPIVETGHCSMYKDVVVADIDECLSPCDFFHKIKEIKDLPPCIITQNKVSNHWQIQFVLDYHLPVRKMIQKYRKSMSGKEFYYPDVESYDINCMRYSTLTCALAYKFKKIFSKTDIHYVGTLCRNPYNSGQNSYFVINHKINRLKNSLVSKVDINILEEFVKDVVIRKNAQIKSPVIEEETDSRHFLTLKYGREWMWNYINGNGSIPQMSELSDYLHSKSIEIGEMCGKEPHTFKEIDSQVKSIYQWCIDNYCQEYKKSNQWKSSIEWNKHQKEAKIKKAKKLKSMFLSLKSAGYSMKDIAECMGMSRNTLYSYLLLFMIIDTVATAVRHNKMYIQYGWDLIISGIKNAIDEMKKSKIHWKEMSSYCNSIEDSEHFVNYDNLRLDGNECELEERFAA